MAKILVVDDETDLEVLIKQKFRKKIRENLYEFVFAINGVDALKKLEKHSDIDVVLSDINMPEMDGLITSKTMTALLCSSWTMPNANASRSWRGPRSSPRAIPRSWSSNSKIQTTEPKSNMPSCITSKHLTGTARSTSRHVGPMTSWRQ